jgi:hypothetical protein
MPAQLYARGSARDFEQPHLLGVGSREIELEPACALPDHQAAQGHAAEIHLELARSGLDGKREGSCLAEGKLLAGDAAEDGRDALEGRLRLGDPNGSPFVEDSGRPLPSGVLANASDLGFSLAGFGSEAAGA